FSVIGPTYSTGILTSGHCGNFQTYQEGAVATTFQQEWFNSLLDVQWHTTAGVEQPKFFDGSNLRTLSGYAYRSDQDVDSYVCHHGKNTGYSCGLIVTNTYAPGTACGYSDCSAYYILVSTSSSCGG